MLRLTHFDEPVVLLDDSRPAGQAGWSYVFHKPVRIIRADLHSDIPQALADIDQAVASGQYVAGYIAYEAAATFERTLSRLEARTPDGPLIWMLVCPGRMRLGPRDVERMLYDNLAGNERSAALTRSAAGDEKSWFEKAFRSVTELIEAGDVYQANLTFAQSLDLKGSPLSLYRMIRARQPVPYGAWIWDGDKRCVLSASPELMIARQGDRLMAEPMKGTAPRGRETSDDQQKHAALKSDEKSRAENLMIVDLIRNDLTRIARPGSVRVPGLFEVSAYPTLLQMTSRIEAAPKSGLTPSDVLRAIFPCGSVTGAPKIRAMQILADLERGPRGVYCGAIGYFGPDGDFCLNVPIRTLTLSRNGAARHQSWTGTMRVGAGLVAESEAAAEYQECLLKAAFLGGDTATVHASQPRALIETMRSQDGVIQNLDAHMDRARSGAAFFGFSFDGDAVQKALSAHLAQHGKSGDRKVRLLLAASGALTITSQTVQPAARTERGLAAISTVTVDAHNPLQRFKTTERHVYNAATEVARRHGLTDILFFNKDGRLAEGAISNIFIRLRGRWLTPPVSDGALPGVMRRSLMTELGAIEAHISAEDLRASEDILLSNAVMGARRVRISDRVFSGFGEMP